MNNKLYIGLEKNEKERVVNDFLSEHPDICHVVYFYPDKWEHLDIDAELKTYNDAIQYSTYYPLLQKTDRSYLIIYDECMRTKKRNDLTYNCMHKYNNQAGYVLVFEFFPLIDDRDDFMILADLVSVRMTKIWRHYNRAVLNEIDVNIVERKPIFNKINIDLTDKEKSAYEAEKKRLFDNLGRKDPDTIPNALEAFVGRWKPREPEYVARNARYKTSTFSQGRKCQEATLIDLPLRTRDFTDWLKLSGCKKAHFLCTNLKVDSFFFNKYQEWFEELNYFYEDAGLHKRKRSGSGAAEDQCGI